jgi:hypothetical protein
MSGPVHNTEFYPSFTSNTLVVKYVCPLFLAIRILGNYRHVYGYFKNVDRVELPWTAQALSL